MKVKYWGDVTPRDLQPCKKKLKTNTTIKSIKPEEATIVSGLNPSLPIRVRVRDTVEKDFCKIKKDWPP